MTDPDPDRLPPEVLAIVDGGHAQTIDYIDQWVRAVYPEILTAHPTDRTLRYFHTAEHLFGITITDPEAPTAVARLANLAAELLLRAAENTHNTESPRRS